VMYRKDFVLGIAEDGDIAFRLGAYDATAQHGDFQEFADGFPVVHGAFSFPYPASGSNKGRPLFPIFPIRHSDGKNLVALADLRIPDRLQPGILEALQGIQHAFVELLAPRRIVEDDLLHIVETDARDIVAGALEVVALLAV